MLASMRWQSLLSLPLAVVALLSACDTAAPRAPAPPSTTTRDDPRPLPTDDDPPVVDVDLLPRGARPAGSFGPARAALRRLLSHQHRNAVADLLGSAAAEATDLPVDVPLNGSLAVGSAELSMPSSDVGRYEVSAMAAATAAVADPTSPVHAGCTPADADDVACWREVVARLGRRAFRRTLASDERDRFVALAQQATRAYAELDLHPEQQGLRFVVAALLQSPHFLYMVERGEPGDDPAARRLTGTELATRMSFFLTGAPPDDELLDAAESGALSSPTALAAAARALLADPRAQQALRAYFTEKLQLDALARDTRPDPALTAEVRAAMVEEALRLVDDVVWTRNTDVRELFRTTDTFVNDELAGYYGFPRPGSGALFAKVATPTEQGRAGLFTRGAFLVHFAHPDRTSPTLRGKFLREQFMCSAVPAPPPGVSTTLPEEDEEQAGLPRTTRDRIEGHARTLSCAGCHSFMDPPGYAFENFDQFGRFRTHENGLPIDASSNLDGAVAADAGGFMANLSARPDVVSCLVRGLYRQAVGHIEGDGQAGVLYDVDTTFIDGGLRLQDALAGIVASDAFRFVDTTDGE